MSAEIKTGRAMSKRCDARYDLGVTLSCRERAGHEGIHLAALIINGVDSEVGWRDTDHGAWLLAPNLGETDEQ